jgi:hypothetical protein
MSSMLGSALVCVFFLIPFILVMVAVYKKAKWKKIFGISRKYDFIRLNRIG